MRLQVPQASLISWSCDIGASLLDNYKKSNPAPDRWCRDKEQGCERCKSEKSRQTTDRQIDIFQKGSVPEAGQTKQVRLSVARRNCRRPIRDTENSGLAGNGNRNYPPIPPTQNQANEDAQQGQRLKLSNSLLQLPPSFPRKYHREINSIDQF